MLIIPKECVFLHQHKLKIMKKIQDYRITSVLLLLFVFVLLTACNKKEAPEAPKNLTAVANDGQIRLSWDEVPNADYYRITVDFHKIDLVGQVTGETFNVFLGNTTDTYFMDVCPFDDINHYKVVAVNEYGFSPISEVSCYHPRVQGEFPDYQGVVMYPNPTSSNYGVNFDALSCEMHRIKVVDLAGQVILDSNIGGEHCYIDVTQYEEGIYHVHVFTDEGEVVKRFVVVSSLYN